jgi:hypothetical protein
MIIKLKPRILLKIILYFIAACSALLTLNAFIGVTYPHTNELPLSCKSFILNRSVSDECTNQISLMKKPNSLSTPICYDNDRYVPCVDLANDLLKNKQLLVISGMVSLITIGILILASSNRFVKR